MLLPFASLSIHRLIGSIGNDIGFASIIAVAILVVLYFAHARETTTLREQLEESQRHIAGLEARIASLTQASGMRRASMPAGTTPAPVAPVPAGARPVASPPSTVRRVPSPATAAASAGPASALATAPAARDGGVVDVSQRNGGGAPGAPAGMGAPALASATRFIPTPATANGHARAAGASPRLVGPFPSRPAARPVEPAGVPHAAGAPAGTSPPRPIGSRPRPASSFPLLEEEPLGPGWLSGRLAPVVIGAVALLVIVAGLIVILGSGGTGTATPSHSAPASRRASSGQATAGHRTHQKLAPFNPAHVTVAVMNGTAVAGLAADVGAKLAGDGYKQGNITNASSQTEQLSYVYYLTGKHEAANLQAAEHVAKALALDPSRVLPANSAVLTSCAISASGASLGSCSANVVVSLGQDRANLASSSATG
jgi:hypothetical protein